MPNITLSVTEELKKKMEKHAEVRWSNAVRAIIEQKLADFEEAEKLAKKCNLKLDDFGTISKKINAAAARHAKALLNETYG